MQLPEDEIIEKYGKQCAHGNRNTLLPYKYEFTCIACGYNVIKRTHEFSKCHWNKINFNNGLKYTEQKIFCICNDVYKIYDGNDNDKIYEVLSTLKNKKFSINNILIEKFKVFLKNTSFEQDYYSRTAIAIYEIGHDFIRLMKWLAYYDRSNYENIKYYDLMGSICKCNIDIVLSVIYEY